jgi:hypothetical protein
MDLSKISDDELQRLYQSAPAPQAAGGAAPKADLAGMSDADLLKLHRGFSDAPTAAEPGDASAAVGRGLIEGVPVVGPYLLAGANRAAAGIRALKNDTRFSDELANVERFGERTAAEHSIAAGAGEIGGGVVGTLPLMAAAPAAFGISGAALPIRMVASSLSGAGLGGADAAVRSGGDLGAIEQGAAIGGGLGAAGPAIGAGVGRVVRAIKGGNPGEHLLREATHGLTESELAAAQSLRDRAMNSPGGPVALSVDEALNAATGGKAVRASQLARVAANSGGEGSRIAGEFYAARPAQVDNAGRALFDRIGAEPASPTGLGFDVQTAARQGVMQTPEGTALSHARAATGPRITPEQAGRTIQDELRGVADGLEARRAAQADIDYRAARAAPETVGIERTATVERPGEPIVTPQQYSRPQFADGAPAPLGPPPGRADGAIQEAGPVSLGRFIAQNGGLPLEGDVLATDLHKFGIPGLGNVARPGGKSIDNFWRERLIEEGYFRPDADGGMARDISSELLRKLQNEQRGVPSYPLGSSRAMGAGLTAGQLGDEYAAALSQAETRLNGDLRAAGIDPASVHPDVRSRTLGALMRGETAEPLDAFERTVNAMREQPAPLVKTPTVTEEIPDVRFGQVDPRPALAAVAEQGRTAKGDVRGALTAAGRDLREPGGDLDMSVAGLLHARERLDFSIRAAQDIGDATKVRDLQATRSALDAQLKSVPEVATADANFAANSAPLEPFTGNNPLGRVVRRDDLTGRMATPAEQVPSIVGQPSAARELLAQPAPNSRQALGRHIETQILDRAAGANGDLSADTLRAAMREHADVLDALPEVRDRLSRLTMARDGMARIEASPLGQIAQRPDVAAATRALFAPNPGPGSHVEVASAMQALARNDAPAAQSLARTYLETVFNEATQQSKGVASQYGGAGFASAIRGNAQQRHNLEAVIRALPEGETRWGGLDRLLTTLEATGYRPAKGSDTAFNHAIQKEFQSGKTHVGQAISDAVTGMVAGAAAGGVKGGIAGLAVGAKHGIGDAMMRARMLNSGEAVARLMFDPKALPDLRALAKSPAGSKNAELFTTRLLSLANAGLAPAREPAPQ